MTELFIKIVNMSISASWIVLAVIIFRILLKKAPKWVNPLLWSIVGLRLFSEASKTHGYCGGAEREYLPE